jgi:hypothetical protein
MVERIPCFLSSATKFFSADFRVITKIVKLIFILIEALLLFHFLLVLS